jgi:signal transduction histidine kinase
MARRMRELDWSRTALGPVERWPQSLRTSVSTCLDCAFPIILWWGPEFAILYNDEYAEILGPAKDPSALGEKGSKVWAEIWDVIGPMLSHVYERAEATRSRDLLLHVDRGYPEEAYFSFSYSPIHAEGGKVGGVFCPVIETTEKVIGERRLRTLRDLAARCKGADSEESAYQAAATVLAANPQDVPFALIYRVDDRDSTARLKAVAGIGVGTDASPHCVSLDEGALDPWSLRTVVTSGQTTIVHELRARFGALPTGAWKVPAHSAMVLPVLLPGQEHPRAILIAAVSPMRALDEDYRTFFGLVATQLASALADAQALEDERRRAAALAELDRAKTAFFSNVSHEFRTPLTLMIGPLQDILSTDCETLPPDTAANLDVAYRNGQRLMKLVNTLLDFSRIEAGRIDASYEPTDLAAFTTELASVFRSAIEKAGLALVVECDPLPAAVYVDRDMWEKIVLNLLSNAFKFTFEGRVRVALEWCGDRVELHVADTGVGIAESDLPRMFERFHRVKHARARTHEGTGIGLALVQELARLHGGTVAVTSREGQGTTFVVSIRTGTTHLPPERITAARQLASTSVGASPYVEEALHWLPGMDAAPGSIATAAAVLPDAIVSDADTSARVLIADDNADMRGYLSRILGQSYRVEAVSDGGAALARIEADPPDLVLTDVMMPTLDGFGLLQAIRADERCRSVPVILLSARAGEEARIEGLRAGADEYLVKPFSGRELLACVASQLQLARQRSDWEAERLRLMRENAAVTATLYTRTQEANQLKDDFLASLSHELRTPLNAILGYARLLRSGRLPADKHPKALETIERNVTSLTQIVEDVLDISRIVSGKMRLNVQAVDFPEVVRGAIDSFVLAAEAKGLRLETVLDPDAGPVSGDPERLQQVLWNLLSNAVKFTNRGGRIQVRLERADSHVEVVVSDTGIGISPDFLPKLFERFRQADSGINRERGGLGVGLSIARQLADMHGGTIEASSGGVDQGSTFRLRLPLMILQPSREQPRREPVRSRRPAGEISVGDLRGVHVLAVDDERDALALVSEVLSTAGARVSTMQSVHEALASLERDVPDVLVADLGMPIEDGYHFIECVRRHPDARVRELPAAALTAYARPADRMKALRAGFQIHLAKPIDPAELITTIAALARRFTVGRADEVT